MKINKITIKNFKSIYEESTFDFTDTVGLWKISGDVGSGKTTIGESLLFGLFGTLKGKTNNSVISWGEKRCVVQIWCESQGHQLYINRTVNSYGQSPIYVTVDGEPLDFTNKLDAQKILETEYYDISRTTVEMLCVISFNNFKSIATMNTSDTRKFLDDVFNFYLLTDYEKRCGVKSSMISQDNIKTKAYISMIENQIKEYDQKISKLESSTANIDNKKKIEIEGRELNAELKLAMALQTHQKARISNILKDINTQIILTKQEGSNLAKDINLLKKGLCPTCGHKLDLSLLDSKEKSRLLLVDKYRVLQDKETKMNNISKKIFDFHIQRINKINARISSLGVEYNKIKEQERIMKDNFSDLKEQAKKDLDLYEIKDNKEVVELNEWNELGSIMSKEMRIKLMHQFTPVINSNIQQYMTQLEQPYIVTFDENFNCMVSVYGTPNIPLASLSTGQLKIVDCVISLGILKTIMHGVRFNICFMDELLSNMDYGLRNTMSELLEKTTKETNRTTYIITHADIDERYFRGDIDVYLRHDGEKNNNFSFYKTTRK